MTTNHNAAGQCESMFKAALALRTKAHKLYQKGKVAESEALHAEAAKIEAERAKLHHQTRIASILDF